MPFHFAEAAANLLTHSALDPVAKIPEYKVCAVAIEVANDARPGTSKAVETCFLFTLRAAASYEPWHETPRGRRADRADRVPQERDTC